MNIKEKCAYIKGLTDGLKLDEDKDEVKVINAILDVLNEIADELEVIDEAVETNSEYIEEIDDDLGALEDYVLGDDDDCDCCDCCDCDDDDDDDDGCDCCCHCGDDDDFRMLMCPNCNEEIYFDDSLEPEELICPACGKAVADDAE